jgi:hypothetical protein
MDLCSSTRYLDADVRRSCFHRTGPQTYCDNTCALKCLKTSHPKGEPLPILEIFLIQDLAESPQRPKVRPGVRPPPSLKNLIS